MTPASCSRHATPMGAWCASRCWPPPRRSAGPGSTMWSRSWSLSATSSMVRASFQTTGFVDSSHTIPGSCVGVSSYFTMSIEDTFSIFYPFIFYSNKDLNLLTYVIFFMAFASVVSLLLLLSFHDYIFFEHKKTKANLCFNHIHI